MTADSRDFDLVRFAAFARGLLMPNLTEPHLVMGADAYDSVCGLSPGWTRMATADESP